MEDELYTGPAYHPCAVEADYPWCDDCWSESAEEWASGMFDE